MGKRIIFREPREYELFIEANETPKHCYDSECRADAMLNVSGPRNLKLYSCNTHVERLIREHVFDNYASLGNVEDSGIIVIYPPW